jgi:outer membrane protein TolC
VSLTNARTAAALLAAGLLAGLGGCLSPEKAERDADETAVALASSFWRERMGGTNDFDIARPADALALKVALEAVRRGDTNAVFPRVESAPALSLDSNGVVRLSLNDALAVGARNNRRYQTLKESVYSKALALDDQLYAFDSTFTGFILGALAGNPEATKASAEAGAGVSRKFEQGATIAGNMAIDVAKMIREDWHSLGWTGDLTVNVPLLRGSGRDIVREPLTQAERDLAYAILAFARYRETYALSLAKAYFGVLRNAQTHRNSGDNEKRLEQNWKRAEMMFRAGRMDRIQTDQAKTDLLNARRDVITSLQSYEDALDSFKMLLGFSPETPFALDDEELRRLEKAMEREAASSTDALAEYPSEEASLFLALQYRYDHAVVEGEMIDAERKVKVAADALRADLSVEGGVDYAAKRRQHAASIDDATDTKARIRFSLPWDRRRERNAYRRALITRDQAVRAFEEDADAIKNEVRAARRALAAARVLYSNKVEAYKTACMRVEANDLFMQSGRSSMRDILEAESALLSARNALCSAVIEWWTGDLSLRTAMGSLTMGENGRWR